MKKRAFHCFSKQNEPFSLTISFFLCGHLRVNINIFFLRNIFQRKTDINRKVDYSPFMIFQSKYHCTIFCLSMEGFFTCPWLNISEMTEDKKTILRYARGYIYYIIVFAYQQKVVLLQYHDQISCAGQLHIKYIVVEFYIKSHFICHKN